MTTKQDILWTALPNGVDGQDVRLSVFVSPRLYTDENLPSPELKQFPDVTSWPKLVQDLHFIVETDAGQGAKGIKPDLAVFEPALWADVFKANTFVRPYKFPDYQQRLLRTFPARSVVSYLVDLYTAAGESSLGELPATPFTQNSNPSLFKLMDDLGDLLSTDFQKRIDWVDRYLLEQKVIPPGRLLPGFSSQAEQDFYQVHRFYDRPENQVGDPYMRRPDPSLAPPDLKDPPELDFHQGLALLGDQPLLLRKLGLVLDLKVPIARLHLEEGTATMLRVQPQWSDDAPPSAFNKDLSPWTKFIFDQSQFRAKPRDPSEIEAGMLRLEGVDDRYANPKALYDLVQVDPDGLALKAINFASTLRSLFRKFDARLTDIDTPTEMGLPSIQSGGLGLLRSERAFLLHQYFLDNDKLNQALTSGQTVELYAEDLLRGYRVDLRAKGAAAWRSLCQRVGSYSFPEIDREPIPFDDEGYLKSGSTTSKDDQTSDLYFHESVFRWNGWSLVAERPGKTIRRVQDPNTGEYQEIPEKVQPETETQFKLVVNAAARPGSLPRLRFGHIYQMRVRITDLAGNSEPHTSQDEAHASDKVAYLRYEPLAQPVLVPRLRFTEGEAVERMVIRSNFNQTTSQYINDPKVLAALQNKPYQYLDFNDRHVVPPKTSQLMAETHGMFDPFFAPGQFDAGFHIALKEEGTLEDDEIVDTTTGQKVKLVPNPIEIILPPSNGGPPGEEPGKYVIHKEEQLQLPYLPDPIGRGAALRDLPGNLPNGTPGLLSIIDPGLKLDVLQVPFDMNWPDAKPFCLRIVERPGHMPPGSCDEALDAPSAPPQWDAQERLLTVFLPKAAHARLRYSTFLSKEDLALMGVWRWLESSPQHNKLLAYALAGAQWMLTPWRDLELVHAVQQPLCEPVIKQLQPHRKIGDTFALLDGMLHLSVPSTSQLDLEAGWVEWVDNSAEPGPKEIAGQAHVFNLPIQPGDPDDLPLLLKDEHRHEFGDTRHRMVDYHLLATTRFREYFPPEITQDPQNITRRGPILSPQVNVPSSARPASAKVVYVLPTFTWQEEITPGAGGMWGAIERSRLGNGLRVYLERPWYSSGNGELLGVVLWPFAQGGYGEKEKYVSLMGMDPVHFSNLPHAVLSADDFTNVAETGSNLSLEESPFAFQVLNFVIGYDVAGFAVEYNAERRLWYADLQFSSERVTSYYPFVRLALARFQPSSIPNAHLSRLVRTDFIQVVPDRHLTLRWLSGKELFMRVTGYTPVDRAHNRIDVTLQRHDPAIPGELGWTPVSLADYLNPIPLPKRPIDVQQNLYAWEEQITLPFERGSQPMRLLVQEYERYQADTYSGIAERVVYADTVEL